MQYYLICKPENALYVRTGMGYIHAAYLDLEGNSIDNLVKSSDNLFECSNCMKEPKKKCYLQ